MFHPQILSVISSLSLLKNNLPALKCTDFKSTVQWVLATLYTSATSTTIKMVRFHNTSKFFPILISIILAFICLFLVHIHRIIQYILFYIWKCQSLSRVQLFVTPWTVACHAPLSMGFSKQEYWSGLPFPSPGDLPDQGLELGSPALAGDSSPPGKIFYICFPSIKKKLWDLSIIICIVFFFLLLCSVPLYEYITIYLFILKLKKFRLPPVWAIINKAVVNILTCLYMYISFFLDEYK